MHSETGYNENSRVCSTQISITISITIFRTVEHFFYTAWVPRYRIS